MVLLDSGKLQEEYAKRHRHWAARNPDKAAREDQQRRGRDRGPGADRGAGGRGPARRRDHRRADRPRMPATSRRTGTSSPPASTSWPSATSRAWARAWAIPPFGHANYGAAMAGSPPRPMLVLEEPVYDQAQAEASLPSSGRPTTRQPLAGRAGHHRHLPRRRAHPRLVDRGAARRGPEERAGPNARLLGRPRPRRRPDPARPGGRRAGRTTSSSNRPTAAASTSREEESLTAARSRPSRTSTDEKGVLLIPSFAIGRTQEVVWALNHLLDAGRIPAA